MTDTHQSRRDTAQLAAASPLRSLAEACKLLLTVVAVAYVLVYLFIAFSRVAYPYELEWMEGGAVDHVSRILNDQSLYAAPSLDFIPYIYTPLYFYISAIVAKITGIGLTPLRLVSLVSSVGCFALILLFVRRYTRDTLCGLIAAGLFAATFRIGGAWFDIARVDSLALLLLLLGMFFLSRPSSMANLILAGVCFFLSFFTKQTALMVALPLCIYLAIYEPGWRKIIFPAVLFSLVGLSTLVMNGLTNGWYSFYVFRLPGQHEILWDVSIDYWASDLGRPLSLAMALAILGMCYSWAKGETKPAAFLAFFGLGMIGASWSSRIHSGGYDNVLIPAYAWIAVGFGIGLKALLDDIIAFSPEPVATRHANAGNARMRSILTLAICLGCLPQFIGLYYPVSDQIPTDADRAAGDSLVAMMKEFNGPVLLASHGYLPTLAGHSSTAQGMAMIDLARSRDQSLWQPLAADLRKAINERKFAAIILDGGWFFMDDIKRNYQPKKTPLFQDDAFLPVTGRESRPTIVLVPRKE